MGKKYLRFFFVVLLFVSCTVQQPENKEVIVSVGSGELTLEMLNKEIPEFLKNEISHEQINSYVQEWIEKELIYQNALKRGMDLDQDFRYELEKAKKQLLVRKYLDRFLNDNTDISDEEIIKYYRENENKYTIKKDQIKALHILVSTRAKANNVIKRINDGEDFETVAKEVSLDYRDKKGAELDYFARHDVVPEIGNRIFRYRENSVTQPIETDFGWHIFKILHKREKGTVIKLEEVKDKIISRLAFNKRTQRYKSLIEDLRSKIRVKTYQDVMKNVYNDSTTISEK